MKKIITLCLVFLMTLNFIFEFKGSYSYAQTKEENETIEKDLKTLGVLIGGDGVDSTSNVTRQEMIIVLVRMLGKEDEALNSNYTHPFNDVANWADKYIAYAYQTGLTKGTSATTFDGTGLVEINQASTFMLRILGYTEGTDYTWNSAYDAAALLNVVDKTNDGLSEKTFNRANLNTLVKDTLVSPKKNSEQLLVNELISDGTIDKEKALSTSTFKNNISNEEKQDEDTSLMIGNFIINSVGNRMYNGNYVSKFSAVNMNEEVINFITELSSPSINQYYEIKYIKATDEKDLYIAKAITNKAMPYKVATDMFIQSVYRNTITLTNGVTYTCLDNARVTGDFNYLSELKTKIVSNNKSLEYNYTYKINKYVLGNKNTILTFDCTMECTSKNLNIDIDNFEFGSYIQDKSYKEPIKWKVLDVDEVNKKALILSEYGLDCKPFNDVFTETSWKDCTLRKWLNEDFLNEAFTDEEQKKILDTDLEDTKDKVFLLSNNDIVNYFGVDSDSRKCKATSYAKKNGAEANSDYCFWWLMNHYYIGPYGLDHGASGDLFHRTSYGSLSLISQIELDGTTFINADFICVRPAMWISIE